MKYQIKMHMEGKVGMSVSFLLGVGATILLIFFYQQTANYDVLSADKLFNNPEIEDNVTLEVHEEKELFPDLDPLLKAAATEDKTVIITTVNWAWTQPDSLLDIFLESFQNGEKIDHLVKHLVIVAFDTRAYERCKLLHPYCFELKVDRNFTAPLRIWSPGYLDLVWEKIRLLQYIVEQGYNFLFTDVDVMWFRNPIKHFTVYADLILSCDHFQGDPENVDNWPNTGLFYVKSNNRTAKMMQYWYDVRGRFDPNHDQNIFNKIKHEMVDSFGIKMIFVDTKYFGGLCSHGDDLNEISTMHSNCCIGLVNKTNDLRIVVNDWKYYTSLSKEDKKKGLVKWGRFQENVLLVEFCYKVVYCPNLLMISLSL